MSQAVNDAAAYYERTDRASAEKLDSTYPAADATEARKRIGYVNAPGEPAAFQDIKEPQGRLQDIKDYRAEMQSDYAWWDTFSPMALFGAAIEAVGHVAAWLNLLDRPVNPQDEIVKPWVGDWAGVRAAADVLNNVGWNLLDVGTNIQWASQGTPVVWQGRAGDGAAVHLMNLVKPFEDAFPPIDKLAGQYKTASDEMITEQQAAELGMPVAREDGSTSRVVCTWSADRNNPSPLEALRINFLQANGLAGIARQCEQQDCDTWTVTRIAGYPAIRANGQLESKYGMCRLITGVADTAAFMVADGDLDAIVKGATEGDAGGPRCDRADRAATMVIQQLKEGG